MRAGPKERATRIINMGAKMSRTKFASVPPKCSVVFRAETAEAEKNTVQSRAANMAAKGYGVHADLSRPV